MMRATPIHSNYRHSMHSLRQFFIGIVCLGVQLGCASTPSTPKNPSLAPELSRDTTYSWASQVQRAHANSQSEAAQDTMLILAFSGGGTRAAALSYGVLKALRDTAIPSPQSDTPSNLLDSVNVISAVSGGSFTAAYYALHGEEIFAHYEPRFLRTNIENLLARAVISPRYWSHGRTDIAIDTFNRQIFDHATFADMARPGAPFVIINATDLGAGSRFSFIQEYFDQLCSRLDDYPVANAVMASAAVPVVFSPVVLRNHPTCNPVVPAWLNQYAADAASGFELGATINGLKSYADKSQRRFVHLIDGGVTGNLGLKALEDMVLAAGGAQEFLQAIHARAPRRVVVISVDSAIRPQRDIDLSAEVPSAWATVDAISDIQLQRYSATTSAQFARRLQTWAAALSQTGDNAIEPYFVPLRFADVEDPHTLETLNAIPTSLALDTAQVDLLIDTAASLLDNNKEFQRLLDDLKHDG